MRATFQFIVLYLSLIVFMALMVSSRGKSPEYYYIKGEEMYEAKQYKKAIGYYDKAISLKNNYISAYFKRGLSNMNLNNDKSAINDFNTIISISKEINGDVYFYRGKAKLNLKDTSSACMDFNSGCEQMSNRACDYTRRICK